MLDERYGDTLRNDSPHEVTGPARLRPLSYISLFFAFVTALSVSSVWVSSGTSPGPLGLFVSVAWTLPTAGTAVGLLGSLHSRRLMRAEHLLPLPGLIENASLIVVVPTIGRNDTVPALERVVASFCEHFPDRFAQARVDVLIEEGCAAQGRIEALASGGTESALTAHRGRLTVRVLTVPMAYQTPNGTRFKARALEFANELRYEAGEVGRDTWVLHMDDDTGIGPDTAQSIAKFIRTQQVAAASGAPVLELAQGVLSYPREIAPNRLLWLADAARPGDDITRFAAMTGRGTPFAGLHGELLLIRASTEWSIGWDFGPDSIVEDSHLALIFCDRYRGQSGWFVGRSYGSSPSTVRDLVRQRERWAWGIIGLVMKTAFPLRHRLFLGYCMATWVIGPYQNIGLILLAGFMLGDSATPLSLWLLPFWALNVAYQYWLYWEGLKVNVGASRSTRRVWWEPLGLLVLIPLFGLWEGWGGIRGLLRYLREDHHQFVVIAKPS